MASDKAFFANKKNTEQTEKSHAVSRDQLIVLRRFLRFFQRKQNGNTADTT